MDTKKIEPEVRIFIEKIKKEFKPNQILLFGSRARGDAWKQSDYDFIIVSDKFKSMPWMKRISKIVQKWDSLVDIDVLPYTLQEFTDKKINSSVVRRAVREGKILFHN